MKGHVPLFSLKVFQKAGETALLFFLVSAQSETKSSTGAVLLFFKTSFRHSNDFFSPSQLISVWKRIAKISICASLRTAQES